MYKSDYNWNQHTSMLMERCPDFNSLKYLRDVYFSHWDKKANWLHSILFEEENTPHVLWGFEAGKGFIFIRCLKGVKGSNSNKKSFLLKDIRDSSSPRGKQKRIVVYVQNWKCSILTNRFRSLCTVRVKKTVAPNWTTRKEFLKSIFELMESINIPL